MSDLINPIQYTSRTFEAVLSDINSDNELVDKPNWWKRGMAGVADISSMWNNALANNLLLRTAYTRRNTQLLLELIDYQILPHSTSTGTIIFYLKNTVTFPFTISRANVVALTKGSVSVSSKRFEARGSLNVTDVNETFTATEVDISSEEITVTRDYMTGEKVRLTTSGTLPAPLAIDTDYYVIRISATEISLATSKANANLGTAIDLTTTGTGTQTIRLYSVQAVVYQQESKDSASIGVSDGVSEFQEYSLPDADILDDTIIVTVNSLTWTKVDTLIDSSSTDRHFRVLYNHDNSITIQFGDGEYGDIPPAFDIYVEYAFGGGTESNVSSIDSVSVYSGSDTNIEGVANTEALTGGGNAQSIANAKILGPLLLKAQARFVTSADGEALCLGYGGVSQSKCIKNEYGVFSAKMVNIANGGGNLSTASKSALQQYLIDRTVFESVDVWVEDATITAVNVTSAGKVLSGYTWTGQVDNYFRLGWKLFLSEAGKEIRDDFISNGVESARELLNTVFTESFDSSDDTQIKDYLENLSPSLVGGDRQSSDAEGFLDSFCHGLDYLTISAPTFPITMDDDEITTIGTLTLTEIT